MSKIRLMIVDDSLFFREFLSRSLASNSAIEIVGIATDAIDAMQKIGDINPQVIALDMEMPKMRGTEFIQSVRPKYPNVRIVVISSNPNNAFDAMHVGATDFAPKPNPQMGIDNTAFLRELVNKIKIAANSNVIKKPTAQMAMPSSKANAPKQVNPLVAAMADLPMPTNLNARNPRSVIAIGASTGGTEAILSVVKDLPANTPGIVIVQHMPPVFTKMYADRVDKNSKMSCKEAQDGDRVESGRILIAAGDKHMRLKSDAQGYYVECKLEDKVSGHCPSVDVLFESVAKTAGSNAIGVILTGMGADGARSLVQMKREGAYTIGQDAESCVVYGMPMVAYNIGGVTDQLPLSKIPHAIVRRLSSR